MQNHKQNKKIDAKRIRRTGKALLAGSLAVTMAAGTVCSPVYAATGQAEKQEVVYANLESDGTVSKVYVVNILSVNGNEVVEDYGDYSELRNMTTTDEIQYEDGKVTIHPSKEKLYYEGTMENAQLPWNISVHYFLDGEEYTAEELAGKSGALRIELSISENSSCDSAFYDNYALQVSLTLDTDLCKNIVADGATQANVGSDKQLTYTVLPGKGTEVEIHADVTDFEMDGISINGVQLNMDIDVDTESGEISDKITELQDAVNDLDSGARELKDGSVDLHTGTKELYDGAGELVNGSNSLMSGAGSLTNGANSLASGAAQVSEGVNTLSAALNGMTTALAENIQTQTANQAAYQAAVEADQAAVANELTAYTSNVANTAANTAAQVAAQVVLNDVTAALAQGQQPDQTAIMAHVQAEVANAVPGAVSTVSSEGVQAAIGTLATDSGNLGGATGALTALNTINSQADLSQLPTLVQGAQDVANGAATLDAGIQTALNGANTLNGSSQALKDGSSQLAAGTDKLAAGATELSQGAGELKDGMIQFDEEGIQKLTSALDGDVSTVIDRIDAVFAAGNDYATFTKLADGQEGRVKFIIRTGSVK